MKFPISMDDFGTGYSTLNLMKSMPIDILKIDGSFIRNIVSNSLDYQIVASICHLARMKKMRVVAEYVENEEIRSAVVALGIDYLQGYTSVLRRHGLTLRTCGVKTREGSKEIRSSPAGGLFLTPGLLEKERQG